MIRGFQTVRIVQWRSAAGRLRWASLPDKQATQKLQPVPPGLDIVWTVLTNCVKVLQDPCPRLSHRSFQMYPLYINVCPCSVCGQSMVTTWCFYGVFACPDLRKPAESKASATNPAPSALAPNVWAKCRAVELCPCHVPAMSLPSSAIICHIWHICHPYQVSVKCNCCKGCKVWRYFGKTSPREAQFVLASQWFLFVSYQVGSWFC